jgi:hypothetical protein
MEALYKACALAECVSGVQPELAFGHTPAKQVADQPS